MAELTAMRRWLTLASIAISGGQESETTCSFIKGRDGIWYMVEMREL